MDRRVTHRVAGTTYGRGRSRTERIRRAALAAIARREWLVQMLALGAAAGCRRAEDRAYLRGNTLIVGVDGYANEKPLSGDEIAEGLVFLPLVTKNRQGDRQGCLATSWEHSSDYSEWTYRLRPGVRWHDGTPVTVDDILFTLDLHGRPDSPVYPGLRTECVVHDRSTLTVRGFGWSKGQADTWVSIVPQHLLGHLDHRQWYEWDFWLRPIGNGPYRFVRYQPQTMVELEANPDYFKGRPTIERVVLKFTRGASLPELLSGNVDAARLSDPAQLSAITDDPRFQTYWRPQFGEAVFSAIFWQNEHPFFRDPNVRLALSLAINRRELVQALDLPIGSSRVDLVYTEGQAQRGEGSEPRHDPSEAARLLDASGWQPPSGDRLRERSLQTFRFTALTLAESPVMESAVYVQNQLVRLGVQMDLQPLERSILRSRIQAKAFEAVVCPARLLAGLSAGPLDAWFGEQSLLGYRNPRMTRLLELSRNTADPEALDQMYREMSDIVRADQPVAFLCQSYARNGIHVVHRRVKGLSAPWRDDPLRSTEDLWLETPP